MRQGFRARISPEFALVFTLCLAPAVAAAADASAWDNDLRSGVRLIRAAAATDSGATILRAGVEVKLQPGWKTYWRYPGDSGVPPAFDFSGSENLGSATVMWPAPVRFSDGSGHSIGYKNSVIFPLRVEPKDPAKPVKLRLKLDYAVCETLCVPAHAKAELVLAGGSSPHDATLKAAERLVPRSVAVGGDAPLALRKVWRESRSGKPMVLFEVAAPGGADVDVFVEGPTPEWALPLPDPVAGAGPGAKRFAFELDGLPTGATAQGAELKLTATAGGDAIEAVFRLD
jgi:DsbC/DsbD-like thiol-disulfide interchange protein